MGKDNIVWLEENTDHRKKQIDEIVKNRKVKPRRVEDLPKVCQTKEELKRLGKTEKVGDWVISVNSQRRVLMHANPPIKHELLTIHDNSLDLLLSDEEVAQLPTRTGVYSVGVFIKWSIKDYPGHPNEKESEFILKNFVRYALVEDLTNRMLGEEEETCA